MINQNILAERRAAGIKYLNMQHPWETVTSSMFPIAKIERYAFGCEVDAAIDAARALSEYLEEVDLAVRAAGVPNLSFGVMGGDTFYLCSMPPYGFDRGMRRTGPKVLGEI